VEVVRPQTRRERLFKKRKGIHPVLATVILIAITLIAAIAIAGFVFGLFGNFLATARVSIYPATCTDNHDGTVTCTFSATNTGNSNTALVGTASMTYADASLGSQTLNAGPSAFAAGTGNLDAGGTQTGFTFTFTENIGYGGPIPGSEFTGSVTLTDGGSAQFSGTFA
jgi:flagellin-like protein